MKDLAIAGVPARPHDARHHAIKRQGLRGGELGGDGLWDDFAVVSQVPTSDHPAGNVAATIRALGSIAQILRMQRADIRELAECAGEMRAQMLLRLVGLARADRLHDQPMMAHDTLRLAR